MGSRSGQQKKKKKNGFESWADDRAYDHTLPCITLLDAKEVQTKCQGQGRAEGVKAKVCKE